jgi:hypothetical protein
MPNKLDELLLRPLKLIYVATVRLVKSALTLPDLIANGAKQRQQRAARHAAETERLDRIRNPSKYLGKP